MSHYQPGQALTYLSGFIWRVKWRVNDGHETLSLLHLAKLVLCEGQGSASLT